MNKKERILVISESDKEIISFALKSAGYSFSFASQEKLGKPGISKKVGVIVADLDCVGEDKIRSFLSLPTLSDTPELILIAGKETISIAHNLLRLGASDYITKPIDTSDLTVRLAKVLEKRALKLENFQYKERLETLLAETVKELQERNEFLQSICDNIPVGLAYLTTDMRIIEANRLWSKYASTMPDLVAGRMWKRLTKALNIAPNIRLEEIFRTTSTETSIISTPDGQFFKFYWVPLPDYSTPGFIEIIDDITEEIKTKAQWETTLNSLSEGVIVLDKNLKINWMNNLIKIWFTGEENIPKELYFATDDADELKRRVIDSCETIKKSVRLESLGKQRIFETTISPVKDDSGKVFQLVVVVQDITEKENILSQLKQKTQRLNELNKRSLERLRTVTLTRRLSDALLLTDNLDDIYHILLTIATANDGFGFNRAFLLLYKRNHNSLQGTCGLGELHPEDVNRVWQELRDTKLEELIRNSSNTTKSKLTELIRKFEFPVEKGSVFERALSSESPIKLRYDEIPIELREKFGLSDVYLLPLNGKSGPIGIIIGDNFVTHEELDPRKLQLLKIFLNQASLAVERAIFSSNLRLKVKELEELNKVLKESKDKLVMAEKLSTIGEMTAKIAHEIRNPLTVVGGFASVLLKNMNENDPNIKYANTISTETKRVIDMVNNLLDFSRFLKISPTINDFNSVVHNTIVLFKEELYKNNIEIKEEYSPDISLFYFDSGALKQVVMNLIKNAQDAMPTGGELNIRTFKGKRFAYLSVRDSGPGIPQEASRKIFEPFFTTRATGIGLGLTISKQIIEGMNGKIWFKSSRPTGTIFFVKIPIKTQKGGENEDHFGN